MILNTAFGNSRVLRNYRDRNFRVRKPCQALQRRIQNRRAGPLALGCLAGGPAREISRNVLAGVIGSVVVGAVLGRGILLGSVSGITLLWATLGALVLIGAYNLAVRNTVSN